MSFENRRVLVTGSTRGIGYATAEAFLALGARVAVNGRRAADVEDAIERLGGERLVAAPGDLSTAAGCTDTVVHAIEQLGGLDVLVNNAGLFTQEPVEDVDEALYDRVMDVNVKGVYFCCRAAIAELRKSGGAIVNLSSESGLVGNLDCALYCASKGAVSNLTRALAYEFAPDVRVNAVCPGVVMTDMLTPQAVQSDNGELDYGALVDLTPMKRIGEPREIAEAIVFLANPDLKFMTGAMLSIDGGATATR